MANNPWAPGRGVSVVRHGPLFHEEETVASTSEAAGIALGRAAAAVTDLEEIHRAALAGEADVKTLAGHLTQLLESARQRHRADGEFLNMAKKCIDLLMAKLRSQDAKLRSQDAAMSSIAQELAILKSELNVNAEHKNRILLGQVAYVVDRAAASYTFATSQPKFTPFSQLRSFRDEGYLSDDQARRFDHFVAFLNKQGWDLETLHKTSKVLRGVRSEAAHGDPAEQAAVKEDSLQEWSGQYLDPISAQLFERLLPLIRLLTVPGKPLVLRSDLPTFI